MIIITTAVVESGIIVAIVISASYFIATYIGSYLSKKVVSNKTNFNFIRKINFFSSVFIYVYVSMSISKTFNDFQIFYSATFFFFFVFILSRLLKFTTNHVKIISFLGFISIFFFIVTLSNYVYLQRGLETVYHNLIHYFPYIIHWKQDDFFFITAISFLFFSVYSSFIQIEMYSVEIQTKENKFIIGIMGTTLLLSSGIMTLVAVTEKIKYNKGSIYIVQLINEKFTPTFSLFFYLLFIISFGCYMAINFILQSQAIQKNTKEYILILFLYALFSIILYYSDSIWIFLIIISFFLLIPLLYLLFCKKYRNTH